MIEERKSNEGIEQPPNEGSNSAHLWANYQSKKARNERWKPIIAGFFGLIVIFLLFVSLWIIAGL